MLGSLLALLSFTGSSLAGADPGAIPKLPNTVKNATAHSPNRANPGFVIRKGTDLFLNGQSFKFRTMNAPNLMGSTSDFENIDSFEVFSRLGVPATRTYILVSIQNNMFPNGQVWASESMVYGWNATTDDWNYNEDYLVLVDKMLAQAAEYGVKIIIPFFNQDYGENNDWFGTITDLIRHRYNISDYKTANLQVDYFTDPEMLRVSKKIISKALSRTNTVNGRVWGKDDTVLAWETGNEMNWGTYNVTNYTNTFFKRAPPGNWTVGIAEHVKSLAPDTLVLDGTFSRICDETTGVCQPMDFAWNTTALQSDAVDMVSYHFYGDGDIKWFKQFALQAANYSKAFLIGEHGFYSDPAHFQMAWNNMTDIPVAGAGIWSMRPHADTSGFLTHGEGGNVYSYHFPGWPNSTYPDFQAGEDQIVHQTYAASFQAVGKPVPFYPIPCVPLLSDASNATTGTVGVTWRGAAWADHYELWSASFHAPFFELVGGHITDNVDQGKLFVPVQPDNAGLNITLRGKVATDPSKIHWHDNKWGGSSAHASSSSRRRLARSEVVQNREFQLAMEKRSRAHHQARGQHASGSVKGSAGGHGGWPTGSWYVVRGISAVQGIPGPFSNPIYIAASESTGGASSAVSSGASSAVSSGASSAASSSASTSVSVSSSTGAASSTAA